MDLAGGDVVSRSRSTVGLPHAHRRQEVDGQVPRDLQTYREHCQADEPKDQYRMAPARLRQHEHCVNR